MNRVITALRAPDARFAQSNKVLYLFVELLCKKAVAWCDSLWLCLIVALY